MGPYQVLPIRPIMDLGAKGNESVLHIPKAPALLEPYDQIN